MILQVMLKTRISSRMSMTMIWTFHSARLPFSIKSCLISIFRLDKYFHDFLHFFSIVNNEWIIMNLMFVREFQACARRLWWSLLFQKLPERIFRNWLVFTIKTIINKKIIILSISDSLTLALAITYNEL